MGTMYFAGMFLGCLIVPRIGDLYGRKKPIIISLGLSVPVYLALIVANNLIAIIILFFFLGFGRAGKA